MKNKLFYFLEEHLAPFAGRIGAQRHVMAIRDAFIGAIPFIIVGSFALVIAYPPFSKQTVNFWTVFATKYHNEIMAPYNYTMAMMALWVVTGLGYHLAKNYRKLNPFLAGLLSLVTFLMLSAPMTDGALPIKNMGGTGIFTAMIIGIFIPEMMQFLIKNNIGLKLPEQVPDKIRQSFDLLIPIALVMIVVYPLSVFIYQKTGMIIPELIMQAFKPLISASDSLWAVLMITLIAQVLWWAGVHGATIASGVIAPFVLSNLAVNQQALAAGVPGKELPTIFAQPFIDFFIQLGGSGATFGLVLLFLRSRSLHLKSIGKLSLIPGCFNINEPVVFGTPIVLNPLFFIPWVVAPLVCGTVTWFAFKLELLHRIVIIPPWTTPAPIGAMWSTNWSIQALVIVAINFTLATIIYFPFFKIYERSLLKEESEQHLRTE
ncbi:MULTISPECIES: PTS sugar transporter subunit IIC [Enterobacterales]|uniref:Permease IIC component n=1 Tax=Hafnia psychrotolerans TaxID=1477018 RepID=A0ABQ1G1Y7_9GAMM|nr:MULTISPECIES: PTS sugar transporter subunit IIC [Enterobacterales]GGA35894.1 permease IIC component [Hafnia psychrotolerans]